MTINNVVRLLSNKNILMSEISRVSSPNVECRFRQAYSITPSAARLGIFFPGNVINKNVGNQVSQWMRIERNGNEKHVYKNVNGILCHRKLPASIPYENISGVRYYVRIWKKFVWIGHGQLCIKSNCLFKSPSGLINVHPLDIIP